MRRVWIVCLCMMPLFCGTYKVKIEPYERVTISAEVAGKIVKLDQRDELKVLDKKVIEIDHALESKELAHTKRKLALLKEQIAIKQNQYNRIKNLKGQSLTTKERYKSELLVLRMQAQDLKNAIAKLEDIIAKKEIYVHRKYLKKLYLKEGSYVAPGLKLMDIEEQNGSRIVLFVNDKDRQAILANKISIDGNKTHGYEVEKVATSTDDRYISSYRVELVKKGRADFGKIVTVKVGE